MEFVMKFRFGMYVWPPSNLFVSSHECTGGSPSPGGLLLFLLSGPMTLGEFTEQIPSFWVVSSLEQAHVRQIQ